MAISSLSIERAARAIWRALHDPKEVRPWDAFEREVYIRAAQAAAEALQPERFAVLPQHEIVLLPHRGEVR